MYKSFLYFQPATFYSLLSWNPLISYIIIMDIHMHVLFYYFFCSLCMQLLRVHHKFTNRIHDYRGALE